MSGEPDDIVEATRQMIHLCREEEQVDVVFFAADLQERFAGVTELEGVPCRVNMTLEPGAVTACRLVRTRKSVLH